MQNIEQLMRQELDGIFVEWMPNQGAFKARKVPRNFLPDFVPATRENDGRGRTKTKGRHITEKCMADAAIFAKYGMSVGKARMKLAIAHNISLETAERAFKEARGKVAR